MSAKRIRRRVLSEKLSISLPNDMASWLIVWLLACVVQIGGWRCQTCGAKV